MSFEIFNRSGEKVGEIREKDSSSGGSSLLRAIIIGVPFGFIAGSIIGVLGLGIVGFGLAYFLGNNSVIAGIAGLITFLYLFIRIMISCVSAFYW